MLQAGLPHSPALVLHSTSLAQVVNPPHTPFKLKPLDEYYELRYWVRGGHEKNSRERWIIWPSLDFFRNRLGMGSTQNSKGLYSIRDLHYPPWKSWKSISFFSRSLRFRFFPMLEFMQSQDLFVYAKWCPNVCLQLLCDAKWRWLSMDKRHLFVSSSLKSRRKKVGNGTTRLVTYKKHLLHASDYAKVSSWRKSGSQSKFFFSHMTI